MGRTKQLNSRSQDLRILSHLYVPPNIFSTYRKEAIMKTGCAFCLSLARASESVSKRKSSAAKLPKDYSQMRSFWYGTINRVRPEGAESRISAAPSVRN